MSLKIGGFLPSFGSDNAVSTPPLVANDPVPEQYQGGTLSVRLEPNDTQQSFVHRALHDHAIKAGLDETEANKFADQWTNKKTTYNHRVDGRSFPYTPTEFAELKKGGSALFDLNPKYDAPDLADLNERVEANRVLVAEPSFAYTPEERMAIRSLMSNLPNPFAEKPVMTVVDGTTKDGSPIDPETALSRYVQQTYNPKTESGSRRVWGDKINELVSQAQSQGVKINLQVVDGTTLVGFTTADKQKLDNLFNEALGITIKGEQGSAKGQRQGTRLALDIPITMVNAVNKAIEGTASIPSFLEDVAKSEAQRMITPPGIGAFPAVEAMIPKVTDVLPKAIPAADLSGFLIPNQSDLFNRDITGKVNPDGQTLGKTAATITGAVIPIPLANAKTVQVTGRVAGEIANAAIRGGTKVARKVEQFRQEAAAGMRTFGQPEFVTAGGAPLTGVIDDATKVKGSNVMESRAFPDYPDLQLPVNKGTWTGAGGNSNWISQKPAVNAATGNKPIPFKDGYPNFSEWSRGEVKLPNMKGDHKVDFDDADDLFAEQKGWFKADGKTPDRAKVEKLRVDEELTWHHHQDMTTMELVPKDINNRVPHTGGASGVKKIANGGN